MKRLLTFSLLLLFFASMSAQIMMKIKVDNTTELNKQDDYITLPASAVKNITFEKVVPPKVDTTLTVSIPTSSITETSAAVQFNLNPTGIAVSNYVVKYDKKGKFDLNNIDNMPGASSSSSRIYLSNLDPNTEYRCWGYVELANGNRVMAKQVADFTTLEQQAIDLSVKFDEVWFSITKGKVVVLIVGDQLRGGEYGLYCSTNSNLLGTPETLVPNTAALGNDGAFITYDFEGLQPNTNYYLKAYVKAPDGRYNEANMNVKTREAIEYIEPEAIDLGLSVKWASFNLGAKSRTENGGYFGWGDATGEETRNRNDYYAPELRETGIRGNADYDLAAAKLGGHWRMPTPAEVLELQRCNPVRRNIDGVEGVLLKGVGSKSGNEIFIPFAGYLGEQKIYDEGVRAYLWTDSVDRGGYAFNVAFIPPGGTLVAEAYGKSNLCTIRAVWDDGSNSGSDPEDPDPSDPSTMAVEGSENNPHTGAIPQDGVDMGLNVKWARWNVGCMTSAGGIGRYYAWGATEDQESYTWANYESNPYYNVPREGIPGGTISADNDVAAQLWDPDGDRGWRMPTEDDFYNLFLNCDKTWTFENGIPGYRFTSRKTGKFVFLPAAGHMLEGTAVYDNEEGRYWTSSAYFTSDPKQDKENANNFYFHHGVIEPMISGFGRYMGLQVRPVKNK